MRFCYWSSSPVDRSVGPGLYRRILPAEQMGHTDLLNSLKAPGRRCLTRIAIDRDSLSDRLIDNRCDGADPPCRIQGAEFVSGSIGTQLEISGWRGGLVMPCFRGRRLVHGVVARPSFSMSERMRRNARRCRILAAPSPMSRIAAISGKLSSSR